MKQGNFYKPRNKITFITKSKVWPDKNGYFRRFYSMRGRRLRREQKRFIRCILVANTIKWIITRRAIRPSRITAGMRRLRSDSKTAYGRPTKQRYRNRFYAKQQLRLFHGEMKETAFRNFFKSHIKSISIRTKSFFGNLESRLDIVFFRMRFLPTIFACRQFIYHQGIEVNSIIEKSPRALINAGDMLAMPLQSWKSLYFDLFQRIYYRRWGLYIMRRRLFKQTKKLFFSLRRPKWKQSFHDSFTRFKKNKNKYLKHDKSRITRIAYILKSLKSDEATLNDQIKIPFTILVQTLQKHLGFSQTLRLFNVYNKSFNELAITADSKATIDQTTNSIYDIDINEYANRLNSFTNIAHECLNLVKQTQVSGLSQERYNVIVKKLLHYQKRAFSTRFRKLKLPRRFRYKKEIKHAHNRFFKRTKLIRFYFKKYKKSVNNKKMIRMKGVHFYIPSYLQRDFRTLRAVKVQSPSEDETFYPFRISLAKRYSFYKSKGFLILTYFIQNSLMNFYVKITKIG